MAVPQLARADDPSTVAVDVTTDGTGAATDCELRDAITVLNQSGVATLDGCAEVVNGGAENRIEFDIGPPDSMHTIAVTGSPLPSVSEPVEIDGTNRGAGVNIDLDGSALAGASDDGLILTAGSEGSHVHDVALHSFPDDGLFLISRSNLVERVITGTKPPAAADLGNGGSGIEIRGDGNEVTASLASGNDDDGIEIVPLSGTSTGADTRITGSIVGMNGIGTAPLANGDDGISAALNAQLPAGDGITVGGTDPIDGPCLTLPLTGTPCNLIAGNGDEQIYVARSGNGHAGLDELLIRGNFVGTTRDGLDAADSTLIGGSCGGEPSGIQIAGAVAGAEIDGNLVSGVPGKGIALTPAPGASGDTGPEGTAIKGNIVGLDRDGDLAVPNQCHGVELSATIRAGDMVFDPVVGTVIGGTTDPTPAGSCDGDCNLISGNGIDGVLINGRVLDTEVLGNFIGTDVSGSVARANGQSGVEVVPADFAPGESLGAIGAPSSRNVISANALDGIRVNSAGAEPLEIRSNLIGTTVDGSTPLGNLESGIRLAASGAGGGTSKVTIGGLAPADGNTIAHNSEDGVTMAGGLGPAVDNPVLGNSIYDNGLLGIDLRFDSATPGVTENNACVAGAGANGCQPFPTIAAAAGGSVAVRGTLTAEPNASYRIELFANAAPDPSGNGEGQRLIGTLDVATDSGGFAEWMYADPGGVLGDGEHVAATATSFAPGDAPLSTSEFSDAVPAPTCDLAGDGAANTLGGGEGAEIICGLGGDDILTGGDGADAIFGGAGDDVLNTDDGGADVLIDCGSGVDTVNADDSAVDPSAAFVGCENVVRPQAPSPDPGPDPGPGPSPDPAPDPGPQPPPGSVDTVAPELKLSGDEKQESKTKVVVKAKCKDEACDLEATGTIKVKILKDSGRVKKTKKFDLKDASRDDVAAGEKKKLKLKFTKTTRKKVKKVIKKKKSKAKVKVTATDAAGNETDKQKFKVTVKR